jgi:hypothetical protein
MYDSPPATVLQERGRPGGRREYPMASVTISVHLRGSEDVRTTDNDEAIYVVLAPDPQDEPRGQEVAIFLPHSDEDALLAIELLGAALDNAASLVEARKSRRFRADLEPKGGRA